MAKRSQNGIHIAASRVNQTLRTAGWAPALVLAASWVLGRTQHTTAFWWPFHLLGGAAVAYFFLEALTRSRDTIGAICFPAKLVFAFALTCTVGLGWELGEFTIDHLTGSHLQTGLAETMLDLAFDGLGAALGLALLSATKRYSGRG